MATAIGGSKQRSNLFITFSSNMPKKLFSSLASSLCRHKPGRIVFKGKQLRRPGANDGKQIVARLCCR